MQFKRCIVNVIIEDETNPVPSRPNPAPTESEKHFPMLLITETLCQYGFKREGVLN